jgi:hypothetical protein
MCDNLVVLYSLVWGMCRPREINVLEIGVSDGTSTLAFLKAAHDSSRARLTSIDIVDVPVAKTLVGLFEFGSRWNFIQGNSHDVLPTLTGKQFEIILIDGDHTYEGARRDLELCKPLLAKEGFLLIHDSHLMAVDHDWSKPHGQKGTPGCGILVGELVSDRNRPFGGGVLFPYGCNMTLFRPASARELNASHEAAVEKGLLP